MSSSSEGAAPGIVGPYLSRVTGDPRWTNCQVNHIAGGKSNLTYLLESPAGKVVLRRPPLGNVLPTAHDVVREHTVIGALNGSGVPVPAVRHLCVDESVLGAPFFVMDYVEGPVVREAFPPGYAERPEQRHDVAVALVDTLAALHAVDPAAVGLSSFGRPDGYLDRQLGRWGRQWAATRDAVEPAASAGLDELAAGLSAAVPVAPTGPIVHGDFRLDNTILDPYEPARIRAVLDWELSTRGDPLADLGLLLVYWTQADDDPDRGAVSPVATVTALPGFPTRAEVTERYALTSGRDVDRISWYVALGAFKLAVVIAGIAARHRAGAMIGPGFGTIADHLPAVIDLGHRALRGNP